jgi:hypothetical protein
VFNSAEFKKRLDTDFEYLVTPLVFDMSNFNSELLVTLLEMSLKSDAFEIEQVFGSSDDAAVTGDLMKVLIIVTCCQ